MRLKGMELVAGLFLGSQSSAVAFIFLGSALWKPYPKDTDLIVVAKPQFYHTQSEVNQLLYSHFSAVANEQGIALPYQDTLAIIKSTNPVNIQSISGDPFFDQMSRDSPYVWVDRETTFSGESLFAQLRK